MKYKIIYTLLAGLLVFGFSNCSLEAPDVEPAIESESDSSTTSGSDQLQVQAFSPADTATNVPVDTYVLIVMSRAVDTSTISANVSVSGATISAVDWSDDFKVIELDLATLSYGTAYTVTVSTGLTASDGQTLDTAYTATFTTTTDPALDPAPYVVAASHLPADGATGQIINPTIQVTFSETVTGVTTTNVEILNDLSLVTGTTDMGANTWQLTLSGALNYGELYTVDLYSGIIDATGNALLENGNETWSFTTMDNPALSDPGTISTVAIDGAWYDVSASDIIIRFTTSFPINTNLCQVDYSTDVTYGASVTGTDSTVGVTTHSITIPDASITDGEKYFYRLQVPTGSVTQTTDPERAGILLSFLSPGNNAGDTNLTTAVTASEVAALQAENQGSYDGSSFVVWKAGTTVYARNFDTDGTLDVTGNWSTPPSIDTNNRSNVRLFSDGYGGVIITLQGATDTYTKRFYDSSNMVFDTDWAATAGATGITLSSAANARAQYVNPTTLANNVYPGFVTKITPTGTTALTTEMPDQAAAALVFDYDIDFNTLADLDTGDYIITSGNISYAAGNFSTNTQTLTKPAYANYFDYTITEDADYAADGDTYALIDVGVAFTSTAAGGGTSGTTLTAQKATNNLGSYVAGDIIVNPDNQQYAYIASITYGGPNDTVTLSDDIGLSGVDSFTACERLEGQIGGTGTARTVKAQTNALWDDDADFTSVTAGTDIILNQTEALATGANAKATASTKHTTTALQLSADIMDDNDDYWIVQFVTPGESILAFGQRDSSASTNQLNDTGTHYTDTTGITAAGVGDLVYNLTDDRYAVIKTDGGTSLTLSRGFVDAAADTDMYIIFDSTEPLVDAGTTTSAGTNQLNDTAASFDTSGGVSVNDLVFAANGTYIAKVTAVASATQLTLDGNTSNTQNYIIVEPRMLFAWENSGTGIQGSLIRHSSTTATNFDIDTSSGTLANVMLVNDGQSGSFVLYDGSNNLYGKRITGIGGFAVGTNGTTAGVTIAALGATGSLIDAQSDGNNGVYILYKDVTNIYLTRRSAALADTWTQTIATVACDVAFTTDSSNRPLIAYTETDYEVRFQRRALAGGATDYTTMAVATLASAPQTGSYGANLSIVSDNNDGAIISWYDTRFYAENGYILFAQAVNSTGTRQWDAGGSDMDGIRIGNTSIYDPADLFLDMVYYNDTGVPWGAVIFWLDNRSAADLYYEVKTNP
ncbi:MAG: Ig-like domain-containing protein [bacterium]|nr:Ig-like domain-containing protein [bacterium]